MLHLLDVCPRGAWLSEEHAVEFLGLASKSALKDAFHEGSLPHVFVEHGKRFDDVPHPFNKHRFFFVQKEGKAVSRPSINFSSWVGICKSLETGKVDSLNPAAQARIRDYTGYTDVADAYPDLKKTNGIIFASDLSGEDDDDGYRYGSNGSRQRSPSKGPSSSNKAEGEIYTRADGKRVRRIKRSNSSHGASSNKEGSVPVFEGKDEKGDGQKVRRIRRSNSSHAATSSKGSTLSGLLAKDEKGNPQKVRKVKRSSSSHSGMSNKTGSLSGFLAKDENEPRPKMSGSRSVGAGEGDIYTRADGKKGKYKDIQLNKETAS